MRDTQLKFLASTAPREARVACVKIPNGEVVSFDVEITTTIGAICCMVATRQDLPENAVNLKYQGKTLNKTSSMGFLGVREETILKVEIIKMERLTLNIKCPENHTVVVEVNNIQEIRFIKTELQDRANIPLAQQILKLRDRTLMNDGERCIDAGITNNCELTVLQKTVPGVTPTAAAAAHHQEASEQANFDKEAVLSSFDVDQGKPIQVAFSFDTTGSMYSCLEQVRTKLRETVTKLIEEIPHMRIALIAHGDYCDCKSSYVTKVLDFTNDVRSLTSFAETVAKTGGGDAPECYEWVLREATQLDWSDDAAKALVVIGDDVPHPPSYTDQLVNWKTEAQLLKAQGVKIYGVRALNNNHARAFYEYISEYTRGAYIEFSNFNVITEMFLAVCYKMAGDEQFENYCEEVAQAADQGVVMHDVKQVLQQIEQADANQSDEAVHQDDIPDRWNVAHAWWCEDRYQNGTKPIAKYSYNCQTKCWSDVDDAPTKAAETKASGKSKGIFSINFKRNRKDSQRCLIM